MAKIEINVDLSSLPIRGPSHFAEIVKSSRRFVSSFSSEADRHGGAKERGKWQDDER